MPFGLINVGATFQRAMDIAFKGLVNKSVVIYLDDITVYSKKRGDHLKDLKQIFQRCLRYGISLNPKKSFFALSEGKLLGFIVSKSGIHIDFDKIKEIFEISLPHNKKSMPSSSVPSSSSLSSSLWTLFAIVHNYRCCKKYHQPKKCDQC